MINIKFLILITQICLFFNLLPTDDPIHDYIIKNITQKPKKIKAELEKFARDISKQMKNFSLSERLQTFPITLNNKDCTCSIDPNHIIYPLIKEKKDSDDKKIINIAGWHISYLKKYLETQSEYVSLHDKQTYCNCHLLRFSINNVNSEIITKTTFPDDWDIKKIIDEIKTMFNQQDNVKYTEEHNLIKFIGYIPYQQTQLPITGFLEVQNPQKIAIKTIFVHPKFFYKNK